LVTLFFLFTPKPVIDPKTKEKIMEELLKWINFDEEAHAKEIEALNQPQRYPSFFPYPSLSLSFLFGPSRSFSALLVPRSLPCPILHPHLPSSSSSSSRLHLLSVFRKYHPMEEQPEPEEAKTDLITHTLAHRTIRKFVKRGK
jgi:hypothetical protein